MTFKASRSFTITLVASLFAAIGFATVSRAQYAPSITAQAWVGYNADFLSTDSSSNHFFLNAQGGSTAAGFWEQANEIAMAVDGYQWAAANEPASLASYVAEINSLCAGFTDKYGHNWSSDAYNDDLNWATMAFARASQATGTASQLADAETNFSVVWSRGQSPAGTGNGLAGLIQIQPPATPNLDSPANFTFVIAGYLLYNITGTATYKSEADSVYTWSMANLYQPTVEAGICNGHTTLTCSKIYDANNLSVGGATGAADYTYNYGIAIEAITLEGNYGVAQNVANWLMFNSNNNNDPYVGTYTLNGTAYNVLPNYQQGGVNGAGYNGIAMRGIGFGLAAGALNAATLSWAQANASAISSIRNASDVSWNDWLTTTPATGLYSWDDSASMATLFDIPSSSIAITAPAVAYTGTSVTLTATVTPAVTATSATGTVQFYGNGKAIGLPVAVLNNAVSLPYTFSATGIESLSAVYSGDANYTASNSQPATLTVAAPSFTVTASPSALQLPAGGSGTSTLTVVSVNGFSGTVAFTCTTGVSIGSCAVSPSSITLAAAGTATAVVTLNANANSAGALTATIGASGTTAGASVSVNASATVAGEVITPNFTLATAPSTLSFTSGAMAGNSTVATITSVNLFSSAVTVACSLSSSTATVQPTCTASPATVTPAANGTASSTITIGSTVTQADDRRPAFPAAPLGSLAIGVLLFAGPRRRRRNTVASLLLLALAASTLGGCSGSSSSNTTPAPRSSAGTYTLTVTATSGAISQTSTVPVSIN